MEKLKIVELYIYNNKQITYDKLLNPSDRSCDEIIS